MISDHLQLDEQGLESDYAKYQELQPQASPKDYMWSLFNRMLLVKKESLDKFYFKQKGVYASMAVFLALFEGKDGKVYDRLSHKAEIDGIRYQDTDLLSDVEVIADKDCPYAMQYDGKVFPLDADIPLANDECKRLWCRCMLCGVPRMDENDDFVLKDSE